MPTPLHEAKADLFRALGHPVRVRALELLLPGPAAGEATCSPRFPSHPPASPSNSPSFATRGWSRPSARTAASTYALATDDVAALMAAARVLPLVGAHEP